MRISTILIAASLSFAISGCGGGPETTESTDNDAPEATQAEDVDRGELDDYFKAIAGSDPDELRTAAGDLAAPGSLAAGYATYLAHVGDADLDSGVGIYPQEYSKNDESYRNCAETFDGEEVCFDFADLETEDGKIADFTVNGNKLGDRLTMGDGSKTAAGDLASIEFLAAYQAASNDNLIVVYKVESQSKAISVYNNTSTYRAPEGRQSTATADSTYIEELAPDSVATMYAVYPRAKPGGEVTLSVVDTNTYNESVVKLKVS